MFFLALRFFLSLNGIFIRDKVAMLTCLAKGYPQYKEIADFMLELGESDDFLEISEAKIINLTEKTKIFIISISE